MKIDLWDYAICMEECGITEKKISEVIEAVKAGVKESAKKSKNMDHVKKQYVFVADDPFDKLINKPVHGWVLQVVADDAPIEALERLNNAGNEYNSTKKGQANPVKSLEEICELVPERILRKNGVWVKTRDGCFSVKESDFGKRFQETRKDDTC